jgi:hypothetical protein
MRCLVVKVRYALAVGAVQLIVIPGQISEFIGTGDGNRTVVFYAFSGVDYRFNSQVPPPFSKV